MEISRTGFQPVRNWRGLARCQTGRKPVVNPQVNIKRRSRDSM